MSLRASHGADASALSSGALDAADLLTIVEATAELVACCDEAGEVRYGNEALRRRCGLADLKELNRAGAAGIFSAAARVRMLDVILPVVRRQGRWQGNSTLRDGAGHELPVTLTVLPRRAGDLGRGYICLMREVRAEPLVLASMKSAEPVREAAPENPFEFIGLLDPSGNLRHANPGSLDAAGVAAADILHRPFWEAPWWQQNAAEQAKLREAVERAAGGNSVRFHTSYRTSDGEVRTIAFSIHPIADESGRVVGLVPEGRDVTELQRAERALRQSEELFSKAFHASPHAMLVAELPHGVLVEANARMCELFGKKREEVIGHTTRELNSWEDPVDRERIYAMIARDGAVRNYQLRVRDPAGRRRWARVSSEVVAFGGRPCILSVLEDITELKETGDALREERNLAAAMVDTAAALVLVLDPMGRIERFNAECQRVTGYLASEILGRNFADVLLPPEDKEAVWASYQRLIASNEGTMRSFQNEWLTRDGQRRMIEWRNSCLFDADGTLSHFVSIGIDVTEQRRIEHALRDSEEKFSKAFRLSGDSLAISEFPRGVFLETNEAYCRLIGRTREEMLGSDGLHLQLWVDPEQRTQYLDMLRKHETVRNFSARFRKATGEVIVCRINAQLVEMAGRPCIFARVDDITRQEEAERALRESEDKFAKVFHASPDPISLTEFPSGRISEVNDAFCRLAEIPREEMIGRNGEELQLWDQLAERERYYELLRRDRRIDDMEATGVTRSGRRIICRVSAHLLEAGGRLAVVTRIRDITEQRMAEIALLESEERFSKAFRSSPDAISISRIDNGTFVDVNEGFVQISGYAREEVIGHSAVELNLWPDSAAREQFVERMRRFGSARDLEVQFRRKSGETRLCWLAAEMTEIGGHPCFITIVRDVTSRVKAEVALRESEERYRIVAEQTGQVVYDLDIPSGEIKWAGAVMRIMGRDVRELAKANLQQWEEWIHPEDRRKTSELLVASMKKKFPFRARYRFQRKDGSYVMVEDNGVFLCDASGDVTRMLGTMSDITENQRLEDQLRHAQKMESIGLLAGGVAHDFNNILTVIQGNVSLTLEDRRLLPDHADSLRQVQHAAEFAANLTRQLLMFSRRQVFQPGRLSLVEVVRRVVQLLQRTIGEHIALRVAPAAPDLPDVRADAGMIEQVLLNLAVNARDAMPRGGELSIVPATLVADAAYVMRVPQAKVGEFTGLHVRDTGSGIPAEVLPRIFDPFFTTKVEGRGTGLGLATVYGIVQQHGGWVEVDSEVGRGTTFSVWFPSVVPTAVPVPVKSVRADPARGHETLLVVEDKEAVRQVLNSLFTRVGYRVLLAEDGAQALELWSRHREEIALLFTDVVMPGGMNGRELVERIRGERPKLKVIYCSGYGADIISSDAIDGPGTHFMTKPFDVMQVTRAVRDLLDGKI